MRRPFSERVGAVSPVVQIGTMDADLRNSVWNLITKWLPTDLRSETEVARLLTEEVLRRPIDHMSNMGPRQWLQAYCEVTAPWYRMYDLLDYLVAHHRRLPLSGHFLTQEAAVQEANRVLEREHSGYRFVGGELTPICDPAEAEEIEKALANAAATRLEGVHVHIKQALALLGQRPDPDYRNSIKESVSAVEAVVKFLGGVRGGGLDAALEALSERVPMHGAFKGALSKLYGYTSDGDGIRHALLDETRVGEEDARFMVVACSAFVNWIIAKAATAGVLKAS